MPRLPLRTIEDAPEEAKAALATAEKNNGYLPNLLRVLANAPVALETYLTVSGINASSSLSLAEREAVQITAAATHGCGFCVAGHSAIADKRAKLDSDVIEALRDKSTVGDARLDAVARFTEAVIASRGNVADTSLAAFKQAGFDDRSALEVVLGISLATLCNFANNLGQAPLNPQMETYRWEPVAVAAAAE
jgi:uncharacterized peroxidase-related enzyme